MADLIFSRTQSEQLTEPIKELLIAFQQDQQKKPGAYIPIHVDEVASKIARFYELIRQIVDWKDENVLRRSAILRILKRNLILKAAGANLKLGLDLNDLAESLIRELIRGGHLPNDQIAEGKIVQVAAILKKTVFLLENTKLGGSSENKNRLYFKTRINFYNWLLEIIACEIEETLLPPVLELNLIRAMTELVGKRIKVVPEGALSSQEIQRLTFIVTCQTLFSLDDAFISYHLIKQEFPQWLQANQDEAACQQIVEKIIPIYQYLDASLNHPLASQFYNHCEKIDAVFMLLGDILNRYRDQPEKLVEVFAEREKLAAELTSVYQQRLKSLRSRIFRLAFFYALSVFLSNWFTYFLIEVPLAHLIYQRFNWFAALVDFLLPTVVMFALVAIIRPPSPDNLNRIIDLTFQMVYSGERVSFYSIKAGKKRRFWGWFLISAIYLATMVSVFGLIAWLLYLARLPITSVILDTLIMGVEIFAALAVRNRARELVVSEGASLGEFILDTLSVPVAKVGSFLAAKWREYNVFTIFFNLFLELPVISFIDFVEAWSNFIKEKRAGIH